MRYIETGRSVDMRSVRALGLARIPNAARLGDHSPEVVQWLVTASAQSSPSSLINIGGG